jgi:DNA-binding CsgD family transcriptional regulator
MKPEINKMLQVWDRLQSEIGKPAALPTISFDEIISSVFAAGPFYFYLIDFADMGISKLSSSFADIHGVPAERIKNVQDILALIHPEDMEFVSKAEEKAHLFVYQQGVEKVTRYKVSYNFRFKTGDGSYRLFNHQSLILSVDEHNNLIRSINIHTDIGHLTQKNNYKWSAIGLMGEPSYLNMEVWDENNTPAMLFSKRELEVLRMIAAGYKTKTIAEKLCITVDTVKAHRKHLLEKSGCANMAELSAKSISEGWI